MFVEYEIDPMWTSDDWILAESNALRDASEKKYTVEEQKYFDFCKSSRIQFELGTLTRKIGKKTVKVSTGKEYDNFILFNRRLMNITTQRFRLRYFPIRGIDYCVF